VDLERNDGVVAHLHKRVQFDGCNRRVGDQSAGRPQRYPVKITIFCDDRTGMLKELTAVISDENADIRGVDLKRDDEGEAIIEFIVEAEDVRHLNRMVLGLKRVKGVRQVQRTQKV